MGSQRQAARAAVGAVVLILAVLPLAESLRVLLYVPLHISEVGTGAFAGFADCTLNHAPFEVEESEGHAIDLLVLVNGHEDDIRKVNLKGLRAAVEARVAASPYLRSGFVDALALTADQYDRRKTTRNWTEGPNLVFYAMMVEGGVVYEQYTRKYDFVQQLEPDCCALAPGWLGDALAPMTSAPGASSVLISGSSIVGDTCMYNEALGLCQPNEAHPWFIREHINGNAAYRVGPGLQRLVKLAKLEHEHWPFDVALWLAADGLGQEEALADCPAVLNVPHPVDEVMFLDPRYWPGGGLVKLVHVPHRMRKPPYDAAAPFLDPSLPVTLTFVSESHRMLAHNLLSSLERLDGNGVRNVIIFSFSRSTYFEMLERFRGVAVVARTDLGLDIQGSTAWKSKDYLKVVDHKIVVVTELLSRRYSVFGLDADCYVFRDYLPLLQSLPRDMMHFSSEAFGAHGYLKKGEPARYLFNAGVFYLPWNERVVQFVDYWRSFITQSKDEQEVLNEIFPCTSMDLPEDCEWRGLPMRLLPPELFLNGMNYFSRQWPSPEQTRRALVVHNNWADGYTTKQFRYQFREIWHGARHSGCANVSAISVGPMELSGATAANVISAYLSFFTFLREKRIDCAITPGFAVHADEVYRLPFDTVFRFNEVSTYTGSLFFPSERWLAGDPPPRVHFDRKARPHYDATLLGQDYYEFHIMATVLDIYLGEYLPISYVCAVDSDRSASEVYLRALRGQLPALVQRLEAIVDSGSSGAATPGGLGAATGGGGVGGGASADGGASSDGAGGGGSAPLAGGNERDEAVYLTGKWRTFAANISRLSGKVYTSGEAFFPRHLSRRFGIPYAFDGRLDLDPFTDVLDWLVCRQATGWIRVKSLGPTWKRLPRKAVLVELLKHVPPAVLEEDLGVLHRLPSLLSNLHKRRLIAPLESIIDNGVSNVEGSLQSLLYFSELAGASAIMPPLSSGHTTNDPSPWADMADAERLYAAFPQLLPPTALVVLQPTAVLDWMQGRQVALTWQQHEANLGTMTRYQDILLRMLRVTSHAWPRTWHISDNNAEELKRNGSFATQPDHPYLGLTDAEALQGLSQFPGDVNFERTFRRLKFDSAAPAHREFALRWREGYSYSDAAAAAASARLASLGRPYGCLHLRLKQEYLNDHKGQPHGDMASTMALAADAARELLAAGSSVYITSDVDLSAWAANLTLEAALGGGPPRRGLKTLQRMKTLGGPSALGVERAAAEGAGTAPVVLTAGGGCGAGVPRMACVAADKATCAGADSFLGNTYSSFTLSICALRGDQACEDLWGRTIGDGRFLF